MAFGGRWSGVVLLTALVVSLLLSVAWSVPAVTSQRSPTLPTRPAEIPYTVPVNPEFLPEQLPNPGPQEFAEAGGSVAVAGVQVAVGEPFASPSGVTYAGEVYVLNTTSGAEYTVVSPHLGYPFQFGSSVALGDGYLVVGAPAETSIYNSSADYAGEVFVFNAANGELLTTLTSPNEQINGLFGASVAISGSTLVVGAPGEALAGVDSGLAYLYSAPTWSVMTLTSPDPQLGGDFGRSVAVSGSDVVVGAPGENSDNGNAYVFSASSGDLVWALPDPVAGDFGLSVAISGSSIAVGSPFSSAGGSATLYSFRSNVSTPLPNPHSSGEFGMSVAIYGTTAVVGSPYQDPDGLAEAGEAYSFSTVSGGLVLGQFIANPPQAAWLYGYGLGSLFGSAVAIGSLGIVVGAPGQNDSGVVSAGAAFLFQNLPLTVSSPLASYLGDFGSSVAVSNGMMVVGAHQEGTGYSGEAFLVDLGTGAITALVDPNAAYDGYFGASVAIDGTYAVVGAPGEYAATGGPSGSGNVYVYTAATGVLVTTLDSPNPQSDGDFGYSVAVSGVDVAVGAPTETPSEYPASAGAAYLFNASSDSLLASFDSLNPISDGFFGYSVAVSGTTVVVGAPFEAPGELSDAGGAYILLAQKEGYYELPLISPNLQVDGWFGNSVAISGSEVFVGAELENDAGQESAGHVYQFVADTGNLAATFSSPSPATNGLFGGSVSTNGATLVVGAPGETGDGIDHAGNVYVYNVASGVAGNAYFSPGAQGFGDFGDSVSIGPGGAIVAGAPGESGESGPVGHAYDL